MSWFSKAHEGSDYNDGTSGADKLDNAIQPGKTYKYIWKVPERAGPGKDGPACATWAYYSDVNPIKDTNSGLIGPLIICKKVKTNGIFMHRKQRATMHFRNVGRSYFDGTCVDASIKRNRV